MVAGDQVDRFANFFEHGSKALRADFHLHTKADREFAYKGDENKFCRDYVQRLVDEDISVGVVTNHNKFNYDEFKALRRAASKQGILLLPGVELSVNDGANGVHTLIIFSDEWLENGADHISSTLSALFKGEAPQNFQNRNMRTAYGLLDTISLLEGRDSPMWSKTMVYGKKFLAGASKSSGRTALSGGEH